MPKYAIGNRVEASFMLTTLTPIRIGKPKGNGPSFQTRIREYFAKMPNGEQSPFKKVPGLHLCRFVILSDLPTQPFPSEVDHLKSPYLMISASIAGDWRVCFAAMLEAMRPQMRDLRKLCQLPRHGRSVCIFGLFGIVQDRLGIFLGAYPESTLHEVHRALEVQPKLREFVIANQGADPKKLQENFKAFMDELENT